PPPGADRARAGPLPAPSPRRRGRGSRRGLAPRPPRRPRRRPEGRRNPTARDDGRRPQRPACGGIRSRTGLAVLVPATGALRALHGGGAVMSRARAIYLVARREILERGRSRAFLISLALTVVFLLAGIFLPTILGGDDQSEKLGVVGTPPPRVAPAPAATADQAKMKIVPSPIADVDSGEAALKNGSLNGLLVVPSGPEKPEFVVKQRDNSSFSQVVGGAWSAASASQVLTDA